ncbi:hypothetical protein B7494_g3321 [Chlorociboria aeruginascens]|nr:hypothetical protein B7494_g3321 [Chlorociboria aeruginascens]
MAPIKEFRGKRAPRQEHLEDKVEHTSTHDGTFCSTVHRNNLAEAQAPIQIYNTTLLSDDKAETQAHLDWLAIKIQKATYDDRDIGYSNKEDRLDVYAFPLPANMSQEEKIKKCISHQISEIAARNATGKVEYLISGTYTEGLYKRHLIILDCLMKELEEKGFLEVYFKAEDDQMSEVSIRRVLGWEGLGVALCGGRDAVTWSYNCYAPDGDTHTELKQ